MNHEQLSILEEGVDVWNRWRDENQLIRPNLEYAELRESDFRNANFDKCNFHRAKLINCNLTGTKLRSANLISADLRGAALRESDIQKADLSRCNLTEAKLQGATFEGALLWATNFTRAEVNGTIFAGAQLADTIFCDTDLGSCLGLEKTTVFGECHISIGTLFKSQAGIPEAFLRNVGMPEEAIEFTRGIWSGPPIQWHSCFISYSTKDEAFVRRLHARMREANMRVWFAPENLKGGEKLSDQLFEAIRLHDRLLLVLSDDSIKSEWVMTEIRKAREVETRENRRKLFPVRLVGLNALQDWTCFDADSGKDLAIEVREYFIPDFSNWKDHDAFEKAFAKLQADLKAETKASE